jgi:hypothetical protein
MHKILLIALLLTFGAISRTASAAEARKVAIVVGANLAPAGRVALRYAHEDARRVVEVLTAVGGFLARDVKLLLEPAPAELLAALDHELLQAAQRREETLVFFYYSGHADQSSLFPSGQALPFAQLKTRLEDPRAKLRVGVLDSCSGGSWTGSKGLKKVEPFQIDLAFQLAEEGSVLIASSSGQESAHETEALHGSFFTHYWNAGLRGAADRGGDGVVTLGEAFEYARTLTIRDTALLGQEPQHPSFQMKLAGRRDFALATLSDQRTTLLYDQKIGPTEVVRLSDGLVVVETSPGQGRIRLGLPAGGYLVRRRSGDKVFARLITLSAGRATTLGEAELDRSTVPAGRAKGLAELGGVSWTGQRGLLSLAIGVRHAPVIDPGLRLSAEDGNGVAIVRASVRLGGGFWWAAPIALVFDAERLSAFNWFAWAGVPVLSGLVPNGESYVVGSILGAGFDARFRQSERHTWNASLSELSAFEWTRSSPETYATQFTLGISETLPDVVTFNLGVGAVANLLVRGDISSAPVDSIERASALSFGSVQRAGLRPLPLIHVPVGAGWAIDAHAVGAYLPARRGWVETYLAGVSYGL